MSEAPRAEVLLEGQRVSTDRGALAFCSVVLVTSGTRRILVDVGHIGILPPLLAALTDRGLTPADIDTVVRTHTHWDHSGNLGSFPDAIIVVSHDEREYARRPHPNDFPSPRWVTLLFDDLGERLHTVTGRVELAPGVEVVPAPGHSAGSVAVVVATDSGRVVVAGDAVQNLHVARTRRNGLVFWDDEQATRTIGALLAEADLLVPGHDQPIRVLPDGGLEYAVGTRIRFTGLDPAAPGVELDPEIPPAQRFIPGLEKQRRWW